MFLFACPVRVDSAQHTGFKIRPWLGPMLDYQLLMIVIHRSNTLHQPFSKMCPFSVNISSAMMSRSLFLFYFISLVYISSSLDTGFLFMVRYSMEYYPAQSSTPYWYRITDQDQDAVGCQRRKIKIKKKRKRRIRSVGSRKVAPCKDQTNYWRVSLDHLRKMEPCVIPFVLAHSMEPPL